MPAANAVIAIPATSPTPQEIEAVATLNFASTLTNVESAAVQVTGVTGAQVGDIVHVQRINGTRQAGERFVGEVSAADTLNIYFQNLSAGTVDLASADFRIRVVRSKS